MNGFQPRFAAFAASFGRTDAAFNTKANRIAFLSWIALAKASAPVAAVMNGRVVDHDAFTAHCWDMARCDLLRGCPA